MKEIKPIQNHDARFHAPPSKAHTLRALVLGAIARGETVIHDPLLADDQLNMINCLEKLGVEISGKDPICVKGCNGILSPVADEIDVGESGVSMNFLISLACLADNPVTITGTSALCRRPVAEVVKGLRQLGCRIEYFRNEGFPPVFVNGGGISGGTASMSGIVTSQYFSSIAISAPYAEKDAILKCIDGMSEKPYFEITLDMMSAFGVNAEIIDSRTTIISSGNRYSGRELRIEGDFSSASFLFLAAAVCRSSITVSGLRKDSRQGDRMILDILKDMGCGVEWYEDEVSVKGIPSLKPVRMNMTDIPDLVPPVAVAAAFAEGCSELTGVGRLKYKESNRLEAIVTNLRKMGTEASHKDDVLTIEGGDDLKGAEIDPFNDHRIAMSFAVAGMALEGQKILNEACVAKSYPDFWDDSVFGKFYRV